MVHPDWSRNAAIYQINLRQFTAAGTLAAATRELPRLKTLGADILWLMPIHPIGEKNRKGRLGSPYSVRDYYGVNPEFGTFDDLKTFVAAAHANGQYVLLDWVANHTACDNPLVAEHSDWYARDRQGRFRPTPWWDWSDIIELDYANPALRRYMTEAMAFWVREAGIDGFRCDVAGFVPLEFWTGVRAALDEVKPVFMLAEWESRDLHAQAFDMSYAWSWYDALQRIAAGGGSLAGLYEYYSGNEKAYPAGAVRMTFVSNHDKNAWHGTEFEQFGDALAAAIVLSVIGEGMPLIYNGQESGNEKRLAFFERDPIVWREHAVGELYRRLLALKKALPALGNGKAGARMLQVPNDRADSVFSFVREASGGGVFAVLNLSAADVTARFADGPHRGGYTDYFSGESVHFAGTTQLELEPWGYRVFTR
ncbi:MAG: alpha-amylase family glycosyl hydrolase [Pseudomonadota bacterium]